MKRLIIVHLIAMLFYMFGAVWGVVEGVDYFVNENPVNWLFLIPLIGGLLVAMFNMINSMFKDNKF